jgi:hypothetical protein
VSVEPDTPENKVQAMPDEAQSKSVASDESAPNLNNIADRMLKELGPVEPPPELNKIGQNKNQTYKHPMMVDIMLALGLLFAMGGLTISFVRSYITHSAQTSILQGNYKAAIGILRSSPIPDILGNLGSDDGEDLLNKALYLDAMEKLDANVNDPTALQELAKIEANSRFYDSAQTQIRQITERKNQDSNKPESIN